MYVAAEDTLSVTKCIGTVAQSRYTQDPGYISISGPVLF